MLTILKLKTPTKVPSPFAAHCGPITWASVVVSSWLPVVALLHKWGWGVMREHTSRVAMKTE